MLDGTRKFSLVDESNKEMKRTLTAVYDALKEKGYNPINQIVWLCRTLSLRNPEPT